VQPLRNTKLQSKLNEEKDKHKAETEENGLINANDYVGLTTYPDPIDYDGCGYEFGDDYCKECEHYRECEKWAEGED
jgi:hypothetical protein